MLSRQSSLMPLSNAVFAMADEEMTHYRIHFRSLFQEGRGLAFPCDAQGRVDLDTLKPHALENYLYARAMIGREFATPVVMACEPDR